LGILNDKNIHHCSGNERCNLQKTEGT
jgi:hypothetical protein